MCLEISLEVVASACKYTARSKPRLLVVSAGDRLGLQDVKQTLYRVTWHSNLEASILPVEARNVVLATSEKLSLANKRPVPVEAVKARCETRSA